MVRPRKLVNLEGQPSDYVEQGGYGPADFGVLLVQHRVLLEASRQLVCYPCYVARHAHEAAHFVEVGPMCCLHASEQIADETLVAGGRGVFPARETLLSAVGGALCSLGPGPPH